MKVKLIPKSLFTKRTVILQVSSEELRQAILNMNNSNRLDSIILEHKMPCVTYRLELT